MLQIEGSGGEKGERKKGEESNYRQTKKNKIIYFRQVQQLHVTGFV